MRGLLARCFTPETLHAMPETECTFPARQLVREMRKAAAEADWANDHAQMLYGCAFVKAINDLRLAHEDLTKCRCWYEAIEQEEAGHDHRA